jgi:uridine kinase
LYVTGISGSGKSTLTLNLAKKLNAEPIHLDWIYDGRDKTQTPFVKFLKENGVDQKKIYKNGKLNYDESDKIFPLLQKYSENHKLIVEGVQLLSDTMTMNTRKILLDEPIISVQTSAKVSFNRATQRDQTVMNYVNFQKAKKVQDLFDNEVKLSIAEAYVDLLLGSN